MKKIFVALFSTLLILSGCSYAPASAARTTKVKFHEAPIAYRRMIAAKNETHLKRQPSDLPYWDDKKYIPQKKQVNSF